MSPRLPSLLRRKLPSVPLRRRSKSNSQRKKLRKQAQLDGAAEAAELCLRGKGAEQRAAGCQEGAVRTAAREQRGAGDENEEIAAGFHLTAKNEIFINPYLRLGSGIHKRTRQRATGSRKPSSTSTNSRPSRRWCGPATSEWMAWLVAGLRSACAALASTH